MDLEEWIGAVYCAVDDLLIDLRGDPGWRRVRRRGPAPALADAEVLTMEVVGEFLGLDQDTATVAHFRRASADWFPALGRVHRTTFVRQAANPWAVEERLWGLLAARIPHDPALSLVDSVPVPARRFGRAFGCRRFRGQAAFGRDAGSRATVYGFRCHLRVAWPGVVVALSMAPADAHDTALVPELVEGAAGRVLGDRNYWAPALAADLAPAGVALLAPFKRRATDPDPAGSRALRRVRWRIETVAGQLTERFHPKRTWARDAWHLTSRLLRKVLSHTTAAHLCTERGHGPLQFARLLA